MSELPNIFGALFECTLQMITHNFEDFPDHRTYFFQLIYAITQHCFEVYFQMSEAQFKLVVDSLCWAFKHTDRVNSELGLMILQNFLERLEEHPTVSLLFVLVSKFLCR
jgi:exportin-1